MEYETGRRGCSHTPLSISGHDKTATERMGRTYALLRWFLRGAPCQSIGCGVHDTTVTIIINDNASVSRQSQLN